MCKVVDTPGRVVQFVIDVSGYLRGASLYVRYKRREDTKNVNKNSY